MTGACLPPTPRKPIGPLLMGYDFPRPDRPGVAVLSDGTRRCSVCMTEITDKAAACTSCKETRR